MKTFSYSFRVRYAETDQMGVAHHSNYAVWFEMSRVEFMRHLGFDYKKVEEEGIYLMLSGLEVKYRKAARFDDVLTITVWMAAVKSRVVVFEYCILNQAEEKIATGKTEHVATNKAYKLVSMPEYLIEMFS